MSCYRFAVRSFRGLKLGHTEKEEAAMSTSFEVCRDLLISTVRHMVAESGSPDGFNAELWIDRWLAESLPALGTPPKDYLSAGNDCGLLVKLLQRTQSGSFS